jgi:phosphoesterase RecJ-like protein
MAERKRRGEASTPRPDLEALCARTAALLRSGQRFLVTTHLEPDGDGVGSAAALALVLASLGRDVTLYSADPIPRKLQFLPGVASFVPEIPPEARFDVTLVTDCSDLTRMGPHFPSADRRGTLVFIDHHVTRGDQADIDFNDETAPAVGEMVQRVLRALEVPLSTEVAECLYASLLTDTGSFRYTNTSPVAMRSAAELLEAGVDPWKMASLLFESEPAERVRLLGLVLQSLDVSPDGRCATLRATQEMLEASGATPEMLDGFVNHARSIVGVEVAIFFFELKEGGYRVSLRSRGQVNVAALAALFGGGGHFHAAGCTVGGDWTEARGRIYQAVQEALG